MALVIYSYGEITHAPWRKYPPYPMPTWTGNFLQTYKVYREERIRIRNSEIDCRMRIYDNLQYQSIVIGFSGFWAADSARSPLRSRSRDLPLRSRSAPAPPYFFQVPLPIRSRSSGFRARSAPVSAPAPAHMLCRVSCRMARLQIFAPYCRLQYGAKISPKS